MKLPSAPHKIYNVRSFIIICGPSYSAPYTSHMVRTIIQYSAPYEKYEVRGCCLSKNTHLSPGCTFTLEKYAL